MVYKYGNNANVASRMTAKASALVSNSILTGTPVIRDYALHFDTATPSSVWNMQSDIDADLKSLNLDTSISLLNTNPANGTYFIGELQYKGTKEESITKSRKVDISGVVNTCVRKVDNGDAINIFRATGSSCSLANPVDVFNPSETGSLEYKTVALFSNSDKIKVGLTVNNAFYGFIAKRVRVSILYTPRLYYSNGSTEVLIGAYNANETLKVEKTVESGRMFITLYRGATTVFKTQITPGVATTTIDARRI
ncbi:hypothetical protein ACQ9BO_08720 [Flavobacterium sp. P21]|uniref:hypothetical protein n=1 Tax=Flavobacterium sp. P21 TaxID=3423948 RepID=UPI003D66B8B4